MKNYFGKLIPTIFAWVGVIVTLALAPTIETYNGHVTTNVSGATNSAYMIGMTAIDDFGGFIMIISLLVGTGLFAIGARTSRNFNVGDIINVIGSVVGAVLVLAFFSGSAIGYFDSLITAGSGVAKTFYGVMVTLVYVIIIGGVGAYQGVKGYRRRKKSSKRYRQI